MAKLALLIGVSEYESGLTPLPGAVRDAEAMWRVLIHPEIGGFAEADVTLLKNPLRQEMEEAIDRLFRDRKKEDLLLLYFSGHGIRDEKGKFYLASRATRKENGRLIKPSAVAATMLHESFGESGSKRQVVILDCCFSGAIAYGMMVKDDGHVQLKEQLGGKGRAILTSSTSTEYSFGSDGTISENSELSIYTRYLVEGIEKGAADADNDGWISVDELHEYAAVRVKEAKPDMTPQIYPVEEGYKILLAKSPKGDPKLKYRKEASQYVDQGRIRPAGITALTILRKRLGLTEADAQEIEAELLRPHQERLANLQLYQGTLVKEIADEFPLSRAAKEAMQRLQVLLGLRDEDIAEIETRIFASLQTKANPQPMQSDPLDRGQDSAISSSSPIPNLFGLLNIDSSTNSVPSNISPGSTTPETATATGSEQELIPSQNQQPISLKTRSFKFAVVTLAADGQEYSRETRQAEQFREDLGNGLHLDMVVIPDGSFMMGSSPTEGVYDERPQHLVHIKSFLLSRYPITQAQWTAVTQLPKINCDLEPYPANFTGRKGSPVECVSWDEAIEFCQRLAQKTGRAYRLPSEAEWEYACRAGTSTPFHFGKSISSEFANYKDINANYRRGTTRVDYFKVANTFGLSDMHGNVWEWCADPWHDNYVDAPTDGSVWINNGDKLWRVARGGSWDVEPYSSARRHRNSHFAKDKTYGFRIACSF